MPSPAVRPMRCTSATTAMSRSTVSTGAACAPRRPDTVTRHATTTAVVEADMIGGVDGMGRQAARGGTCLTLAASTPRPRRPAETAVAGEREIEARRAALVEHLDAA